MPETYTLNMKLIDSTKKRGTLPAIRGWTNGFVKTNWLQRRSGFRFKFDSPTEPCPLDPAPQKFVLFKGTADVCLSVETPANSKEFDRCSNFLGPEGLVRSGGGSGLTGTEKLTESVLLLFADCSLLVFSVIQQSLELK